jgi:hypothetical protein
MFKEVFCSINWSGSELMQHEDDKPMNFLTEKCVEMIPSEGDQGLNIHW